MMFFVKKWLLSTLSVVLVSCGSMRQEVVPEGLADQSSKVVVACFISPQDDLLTATVSRSRPILDTNAAKQVEIADARVSLSDGTTGVNLPYNAQQGFYSIDAKKLPIRPGVTYTLTVQTPAGQQVTATTRVPAIVALTTLQIDSMATASGELVAQKEYRLIGTWQNTASTYFRVKGTVVGISSGNASHTQAVPFALADNSLGLLASQEQESNLSVTAALGNKSLKSQYRNIAISLDLLHVDEAYYQYHLALDRQLKASSNPFAEAVVIPSNIEGGLGCFGSYNRSTLTVALK